MAQQKKIICNKCGRVIENKETFLGFTADLGIGYGSKYDGETIRIDLCTDCIDRLIETCVVSPLQTTTEDEDPHAIWWKKNE